jgi:iron(III) transport system substrate-binding protein
MKWSRLMVMLASLALALGAAGPASAQKKLVVYTSNESTLNDLVFGAFTKETGIAVEPVSAGSGVVMRRLQAEKARPLADIVWGVSRSLLQTNKALFQPYASKNKEATPADYRDPDDLWIGNNLHLLVILQNTKMVQEGAGSEGNGPKGWADLLDPKWKGKVSTGHPAFSGYVGTWVLTMRKLYGWSFFNKLEKNKPQIGRSINDTVTALVAGERQVAAGADGSTLFSAARGNPLAIIYPSDGSVLIIAPSAIVKGTKHPNAAKLFMEYLNSVEASKINTKHFAVPLRPEVPAPPGAKPVGEVKTVRPTIAEIDKGVPEVIEQWRDTYGN